VSKGFRIAAVTTAAVATMGMAAAGAAARPAATSHAKAAADVCVLLPDTKSSTRYTLFDAPLLAAAFQKAGVTANIVNAQGDPQKMRSQADDCITNGAKVVLLDALDPGSGASITNAVVTGGAKVIDYDRLVPKSKAKLYVSFDNVKVGKLQGLGLVAGLRAKGMMSKKPVVVELNGAVTDNNAKLFKQGYDSILGPLYKKGVLVKGAAGDQWTNWDPIKAQTIFEQMLARNNNKIDAALSANDGIAGAVISTLQNKGLKPIPVTGQDATPTGVQYIISGWQSGTIYKPTKLEANTAAKAAIALLHNQAVKTNAKVSGMRSILLTPVWVTKKNYTILFRDGQVKKGAVCVGKYAKYCK
jgi:D-xylose transport system substrate-binding protein